MSISYKSLVMAAKKGETLDEVAEEFGKTVEDFKKEVYKRLNKKAANDLLSRLESNAKSKEKKSKVAKDCVHESSFEDDSPVCASHSKEECAASEDEPELEKLKKNLEEYQTFSDTLKNKLKCIGASKAELEEKLDREKIELQHLTQAVASLVGRVTEIRKKKDILCHEEKEIAEQLAASSEKISALEQEIMSRTILVLSFDEEPQIDIEREEIIAQTTEIFEITDDEKLMIFEVKKIALWLCILRKLEMENPEITIQVKFKEENNIAKYLASYGKNVIFG